MVLRPMQDRAYGTSGPPPESTVMVRVAGVALILGALGFVMVFAYLALRYSYPKVLRMPAAAALPALLDLGGVGRVMWTFYALLPLLLIPAGVGTFHALRKTNEATMRVAMNLSLVSAIAMTLGLMRWPSAHWHLAIGYEVAGAEGRRVISAVYESLNSWLGVFIGDFLGELCLGAFFVLSGFTMWRTHRFPKWVSALSVVFGALAWVTMWRNVILVLRPIGMLYGGLLPLWLIVFGVYLLKYKSDRPGARKPRGSAPVRESSKTEGLVAEGPDRDPADEGPAT